MKKRILSFALVISIMTSLFVMFPITANAETEGIFTYSIENGEVTITGCDYSASGDIEIPSTISGYPVTAIGNMAFYCCESIRSITIPDSVTSIGEGAFAFCTKLTSVTIPDGVTSLGECVFSDCSRLESITIPVSVTSIGDMAFSYCYSLTDVYYAGTEEEWNEIYISDDDNGALFDATIHFIGVTEPDITSYLTYIIENGEVTITRYDYSASGDIEIPATIEGYPVTAIGEGAFYYCNGLTSVTIPDSVTSIGGWAFDQCTSITSITIPDSVTSIGDGAFISCVGLTSITIPASVTNMGMVVFNGCESLTSINVDEDNPNYSSVDGILFNKDKTELIQYPTGKPDTTYDIPSGVTSIGMGAFVYCINLTNITIPDSVTSIGIGAFLGCTSLTCIDIPSSVTSIGEAAFVGCTSLTCINVDEDNPNYSSVDGNLFNKEKTELVLYALGKPDTTYDIPTSVTNIGIGAFAFCINLTNITIPESVTNIETGAFSDCESLTSITIPDGVTSIGDSAFERCSSLANITIPGSVTSIGDSAFYSCGSLPSITIPDSVTSVGDSAFENCSNLTSITIPDSVTSIGNYAFNQCDNLTDVYYGGTEEAWESVIIGDYNESLSNATIHYAESMPSAVGDANEDGVVDVGDVTYMRQGIAGGYGVVVNETIADANKDGTFDVGDVTHLRQFIAGGYGIEL